MPLNNFLSRPSGSGQKENLLQMASNNFIPIKKIQANLQKLFN